MPRVTQITTSHCGPAVLQMLVSFLGYDIDQDRFVDAAEIRTRFKDYGITVPEMAEAIHQLTPDLDFWYKKNSTLMELKQVVNVHKFPAGVEWQGVFEEDEDDDDGHYSVATYIDSAHGTIHLADPYEVYAGRDRIFGLHLFEKRWWDVNEVTDIETGLINHIADDRTLFVVTPQYITFPADLGMEKG